MAVGALVAGGTTFAGIEGWHGVPGGLIGLGLNVVICVVGSILFPHRDPESSDTRPYVTSQALSASTSQEATR